MLKRGGQMEGISQNPWISLLRQKGRVGVNKAGLGKEGTVSNQRKAERAS